MKKHNYLFPAMVLFSLISIASVAQTAAKNDLLLSLGYFNNNNQTQYLSAKAKTKIDGKFQMVAGINLSFYITNDSSSANLLGKAVTDGKGNAYLLIPPAAQTEWKKSAKQSFVAVSAASKLYDESKATAQIAKAKLKIDTAADKKINVTALELKDTAWVPVKGVELKVAVKRMGGDLNVSETQTYTTDSTGTISAEYKRDSLAGDAKGNLVLIAKVEDNDTYGNLSVEQTVPWGNKTEYISAFDKRTLFARRGHSPIWLELMAYSIIVAVWGVLIYLIGQMRKIKALGA
jgi:hypothetical protein